MNVNIHVIMQNICTFIYIKYGTSVQDTEAVRKTPTTYPKEKFLIYLLGSQGKKKKGSDRFHLSLLFVVYHYT